MSQVGYRGPACSHRAPDRASRGLSGSPLCSAARPRGRPAPRGQQRDSRPLRMRGPARRDAGSLDLAVTRGRAGAQRVHRAVQNAPHLRYGDAEDGTLTAQDRFTTRSAGGDLVALTGGSPVGQVAAAVAGPAYEACPGRTCGPKRENSWGAGYGSRHNARPLGRHRHGRDPEPRNRSRCVASGSCSAGDTAARSWTATAPGGAGGSRWTCADPECPTCDPASASAGSSHVMVRAQ